MEIIRREKIISLGSAPALELNRQYSPACFFNIASKEGTKVIGVDIAARWYSEPPGSGKSTLLVEGRAEQYDYFTKTIKIMQKNYQKIKARFQDIESLMQNPANLSNPQKLKNLTLEYNELKEKKELIDKIEKLEANLKQAEETLNSSDEEEIKTLAEEELVNVKSQMINIENQLEELLKPQDPMDKRGIIMEIRAAAGGDESSIFAADMFRMYARYAEKHGWRVSILSSSRIGIGGFKEVIFEIKGTNVYRDLKYESGVHRVQRIPETEKSGRIHTSTATVAVLPEAEDIEINIKPDDLRIDVFRSSGPGGQSVNTTDSAVRITHLPTGLTVSCQDEKSQHKNKDKGLRILKSRLLKQEQERQKSQIDAERRGQIGHGDRSEKIRTYNFPQDRVTDHRIKQSWGQIERVLNGELEQIIEVLKNIS
ncbi:MAG: peptide chain release factor 1 [Patescibacteria group bacterium]